HQRSPAVPTPRTEPTDRAHGLERALQQVERPDTYATATQLDFELEGGVGGRGYQARSRQFAGDCVDDTVAEIARAGAHDASTIRQGGGRVQLQVPRDLAQPHHYLGPLPDATKQVVLGLFDPGQIAAVM